MLDAS
jgi:hypothetical protein